MSQDIEDLGWGFLRHMQWPGGAQDQVEIEPVKSSKSAHKKSMGVAVAVALSLTVGAVGLYLWKRDRVEPEPVAESEEVEYVEYEYPPHAPAPAPIEVFEPMRTRPAPAVGRRPLTEGVPLPFAHDEFEKIMKMARTMVAFSRDPQGQLVLTWAWTWKGTPYPLSDHPDDHPSVRQAKKIVATAVELARAERAAQAEREGELDEDELDEDEDDEHDEHDEQLTAESVEELTCELPRPGYFFCAREGDELLGDAGLVTGALLVEAMSVGFDAGWDRETTEAHASELAADTGARAAYAELIRESEWNAGQVEELAEGTLLWLPPLEPLTLGEGNRRPRIDVDARPWPDGSSRLEPPPQLRLS
jgi:hypothetical protein